VGTPLHRLLRGRGLRWALTVVLAVGAGTLAAGTVQRAEQARAAYGESRRVPVATGDLEVGAELGAADVGWADLPVALLPDGVADAPNGRIVTEPVVRGEVILERRLSGGTSHGTIALIGPGRRAVAVPTDTAAPTLAVGDRVDAYASDSVGSLSDAARARAGGARRVARDALVVAVDDRTATIAVAAAEAPGVAGALLDGALTIALVGSG
jgi:Flp pilus assembly protein CpaB